MHKLYYTCMYVAWGDHINFSDTVVFTVYFHDQCVIMFGQKLVIYNYVDYPARANLRTMYVGTIEQRS